MTELTYALRFQGTVVRAGPDGNVLRATSHAPGSTLAPVAGDVLGSSVRTASGDEARLESELIFTGATTFQESGVIEIGKEGNRIRFSSLGTGYLEPASLGQVRRGAVIWRVDGGAGRFEGAGGLIVSLISLTGSNEITEHQLGMLTWS